LTGFQEAGAKKAVASYSIRRLFRIHRSPFSTAVLAIPVPVIEVHISNIHAAKVFVIIRMFSRGAKAVICGFGVAATVLAIDGLVTT